MSQHKKKMVVVCHDAGGAEVISAFIKANPYAYEYMPFVGGPAKSIFGHKEIEVTEISDSSEYLISNRFEDGEIDIVLTGIDWSSTMTLNTLKAAKKKGIYTIVYLDHWVYYKERLGYPRSGWEQALPDEIWAGDAFALERAKELFPNIKVKMEPNLYFEEVKKNYHDYISKKGKNVKGNSVLFISERIGESRRLFGDLDRATNDEYRVINNFLQVLSNIGFNKKIIVRFHPSEKSNKYDDILKTHQGRLLIEKSFGRSIYEDLVASYIVIGMESMALVVALLCGKKVVSILPDCRLPFPEIQKVGDMNKLAALLSRLCAAAESA